MATCPKCNSPFFLPFFPGTVSCLGCSFETAEEPSKDSIWNPSEPVRSDLPEALTVIKTLELEGKIDDSALAGAWKEFEALDSSDKSRLLIAGVGCRLATVTNQWTRGLEYADTVRTSPDASEKCKEAAARFYHANARRLFETGESEEGRRQADLACEAWEGIRDEIREDKTISGTS